MEGRDNEPYAPGFISMLNFGRSGAVNFLVDTGNATTCIGEPDSIKMGIDPRNLPMPRAHHIGIGGRGNAREIEGPVIVCLIDEEKKLHEAELDRINVLLNLREEHRKSDKIRHINYPFPALLGRDFLKRLDCKLHFDFKNWDMYIEI